MRPRVVLPTQTQHHMRTSNRTTYHTRSNMCEEELNNIKYLSNLTFESVVASTRRHFIRYHWPPGPERDCVRARPSRKMSRVTIFAIATNAKKTARELPVAIDFRICVQMVQPHSRRQRKECALTGIDHLDTPALILVDRSQGFTQVR